MTTYKGDTDASLLNETTSPATNVDFSAEIFRETGISGFKYLLYFNTEVWNDWVEYSSMLVHDIANADNANNFDGKALRMVVEVEGGLVAEDFACLSDKFEWDANEDGALCIQYVNSSDVVYTHRLTPR